ncbi:MAG: response regulator [Candidatus Electrothrix sp. AS4_5]|nr:response regulator [Candidatus Electrothrix gigas]MCI5191276.1 response regulator [Candidatus Electrothrix gigas]
MNTNNYSSNILIIEDDADWSMTIKLCVDNICSCAHVEIAENFSEAFFYIENNIFDLIILDIRLYDTGETFEGIHIFNYLQENKQDVPVVIVSAHARTEYISDIFEIKNVRYFSKQRFDAVEFQNVVNSLLAKKITLPEKKDAQPVNELE